MYLQIMTLLLTLNTKFFKYIISLFLYLQKLVYNYQIFKTVFIYIFTSSFFIIGYLYLYSFSILKYP